MIHESTKQFEKAMTFVGLAPCPQDGRWLIPTDSDICTEIETVALVFGFVRALKPGLVVETGSNVGVVSQAIAQALAANGFGMLYTCDTEQKFVEAARERVGKRHAVYLGTGLDLVQTVSADLYWIDSSEASRVEELRWLREHGKKGAVVLAHDTSLIGCVADEVRKLPNWVLLPGPRGLGVATL